MSAVSNSVMPASSAMRMARTSRHRPPAAGLTSGEGQRSGFDVGVLALLVRVGVVTVVLVHPPTETQPDRQVAIQQSDELVGPRRSGDLSVPGLVADEADLVKTNARNAATASCHQESPTRTKAVQPTASSPVVTAILRT
jgi:hypothetical protein